MDIPQIDSPLVREAGENVVKQVQDAVNSGEITTLEQLRAEVFSKYIEYFQTLGSNPFHPETYGEYEYKNPDVYNANQLGINSALSLLFRENQDLNQQLVSQFTLMKEGSTDIINKINSVTREINALRNQVEQRQFLSAGQSVVTISDNFSDGTKIDWDRSNVSIDFQSSFVTLKITDNLSRSEFVDEVTVTNVNKDTDGAAVYVEDKLPSDPAFYEGDRFGVARDARPEGGSWRIETKNQTIDTANPALNFDENYTSLTEDLFDDEDNIVTKQGDGYRLNPDIEGKRITPEEFMFDDPASGNSNTEWDTPYGGTITRDDIKYVEVKATEEQLEEKRLEMFDNDPRTFWEIEYTPVIPALEAALDAASDTDDAAYADYQLLAQEYLRNNSSDHLECTLKIVLDNVYSLNYIDLTPVFFTNADDANYEVLEILTQAGEGEIQEGIPNFESYDNVIGRDSNKSITKENMAQANVFNKFAFRGKGIWTFPKRRVKIITVKVKQDYAIPNPYPLKNVQLLKKSTYSINQSKSFNKSEASGFKSSTTNVAGSGNQLERGRTSRLVQFGYLETIAADLQNDNTGLLAGATSSSNAATNNSFENQFRETDSTGDVLMQIGGAVGAIVGSTDQAVTGSAIAAAATIIGATLNSSSASGGSQSTSQNYNDSGFQVNSEYYRTLWTRARYAIGIADIGLWSKVYEEDGQLTSLPFEVANGNKELTLTVNENIPSTFLEFDDQKAWIEYFVVLNDVEYRINPIIGTVRAAGHDQYPSRIVLDREFDSDRVIVRFLAKKFRPLESQLESAESETTILNGYEIKIIDL